VDAAIVFSPTINVFVVVDAAIELSSTTNVFVVLVMTSGSAGISNGTTKSFPASFISNHTVNSSNVK
tara:strand:+ start:214 stop:414 length:201 start_codon:yes stop_codon:yes gene_type:complete